MTQHMLEYSVLVVAVTAELCNFSLSYDGNG